MEKKLQSQADECFAENYSLYIAVTVRNTETVRGQVKRLSALKQVAYIHAVYTLPLMFNST
jgi:tryptophanase